MQDTMVDGASRTRLASALAGAALLASAAAASEPVTVPAWGYTIGEQREAQQVNLCRNAGEARELAGIFRKYGVRAGFAALSGAQACDRRIAAVTPVAIIDEVTVSPVAAEAYHVRFVEVLLGSGASGLVLVTTRAVHAR